MMNYNLVLSIVYHLFKSLFFLALFCDLTSHCDHYLSLSAAVVHASNCGPSLLSLLHGNMIQSTIAALKGSQSLIKKSTTLSSSSHTPQNNFNRNNTINNKKTDQNSIGNIYRNDANSSPLIQLLTSSSFSTNDAHSLPTEIREVSLKKRYL